MALGSQPAMQVQPKPRSIRVLDASEIQGDVDRFYRHFAHEPLILRNAFPPTHSLRALDLDGVRRLLGDVPIAVYNSISLGYLEISAATLFEEMHSKEPRYNVVDHSVVEAPLGKLFEPPPFLRHNWFEHAPANFDSMTKSVVLSPAQSFTPIHLDAYGMQGWMYLIAGRKHWRVYHPKDLLLLWDPVFKSFYDPRKHDLAQYPARHLAEPWEGTLEAGELFYFPAGWVHEVSTPVPSFGVGGSVFNDYQIVEHMRWWLWEKTLRLQGTLDLARVVREMPRERFSGPEGRARAEQALALYESWRKRMNEELDHAPATASW